MTLPGSMASVSSLTVQAPIWARFCSSRPEKKTRALPCPVSTANGAAP